MVILLPYLVAVEKEKKMNLSPSRPSGKEGEWFIFFSFSTATR